MPRAFLIKNKRSRVDSIADELLARQEIDDGGQEPSFSSSNLGQHIHTERLSKLSVDAVDLEIETRGFRNLHPAYTLNPGLYPPPPPLLRLSAGSAFEKVHPVGPESVGVRYSPLPGQGDPHRLVLNSWLAGYPELPGHNILRDRLLNHPASAFLLADPKHGLHQLPPRGLPSKPVDEPLNLKIREPSREGREDSRDESSRPSKRYHPEDVLPMKKRPLAGPQRLHPMEPEDQPRYPPMASAIHPAAYPFLSIPYSHLLAQKYPAGFGLRPVDRDYFLNQRGHRLQKTDMSPPMPQHVSPHGDREQSLSVSPTFDDQDESNGSSSSPKSSPYRTSTILNQPRYPLSQGVMDGSDNDLQSPSSPTGGKRLTRQPILGVEYIQNGIDNELKHDMDQEAENDELELQDPEEQYLLPERPNQETDTVIGCPPPNSDEKVSLPIIPKFAGESKPGRRSNSAKTPQPRKYICDICGKGFSRSNTLVTHKRIHTGDKPFACELCGRAFRQPGNLTRHRLTHTTVKPYVCTQCGKAFNRASNLHTHMRTHTNYKPFVCQYCGKGFHQKIDMKIHSYTHTGEKPHKCKKCGRGFKQLTHLTYHMRTHSEVKMYTCAYCGKGFNQKGNLQAHIYRHTGERPYRCEVCDKGFTLASTLNTHRRTHAEKKPFACQYCGKDFYQRNALKSHLLASHPYTGGESLL